MTLRELIRSDLSRFTQTFVLRKQAFSRRRVFWESLLFKAGFQAVLFYRISHWLFCRGWIYLPWFLSRFSLAITGADIAFSILLSLSAGRRRFLASSVRMNTTRMG